MLTVGQVRAEVARVSYRPGWSLTVEERGFEDPWLRVLALDVGDAANPGQSIDLGVDSPIPPMADVDALHRWLVWRLGRIESHESREFYRVGGFPLFDPHRGERSSLTM
jgi:hypothetical protein